MKDFPGWIQISLRQVEEEWASAVSIAPPTMSQIWIQSNQVSIVFNSKYFASLYLEHTGCTTAVLYTLPGSYDKTMRCTKKIMLNIFSVWPDISFDNIKMEKITDISFFNRNNRNYKNNIFKLHKIFKIVSRLLKTKFGSVSVI